MSILTSLDLEAALTICESFIARSLPINCTTLLLYGDAAPVIELYCKYLVMPPYPNLSATEIGASRGWLIAMTLEEEHKKFIAFEYELSSVSFAYVEEFCRV